MSNIDEKLASIPTSPLLAERMTKEQPSRENDPKIAGCSDDTISRQAAVDALSKLMVPYGDGSYPGDDEKAAYDEALVDAIHELENLPTVQSDEKLEKCRFEYINACRIVTYPTPDTTKKDISDAYAVIKVLQPIFGDVTF